MLLTYRPRTWHLAVVALIALADLGVAYLVLNPRVADDYRAYYIDRTSSCFPRVITGYYPLGTPVTFVPGRSGYARDNIRWCGFKPPSTTGIRSFGDYGILKLKFPVPDDDLLLTFSSWTNTGADKPRREVKVVVNGEQVGTLVYTKRDRVDGKIVIPQRLAKLSKADGMEIRFDVPRIGPPGTNSEPVTLELRLEALRLVALGNAPLTTQPGVVVVEDTGSVAAPKTEEAGLPPPPNSHRWAP
jgi:hypothetical protein